MSVIINVGSVVPYDEFSTRVRDETAARGVRTNTKTMMSFLQNLHVDKYIGDTSLRSELGDVDFSNFDLSEPREIHYIENGLPPVVYKCSRRIGVGGYGFVFEFTATDHRDAPRSFALKIPKSKLDPNDTSSNLPEFTHERNVIEYFDEMGVFGEIMCVVP